ncbi:MAG: isoprenyl transferase [Candidatus Omnitrophica bacterium]|nr:isoprenyl transferase [Candidatus Omnitrophota bacterium]
MIIPEHIAIIMDGNGRWAKARGLARTQGHVEGVKRVDEITDAAAKLGVKVLTLYTFSTENWTRPASEVSMLMQTLVSVLTQKLRKLHDNNVRFCVSGRRQGAPQSVLRAFDQAAEYTRNNTGLTLNIAFNYGGRQEILDAVKAFASDALAGKVAMDALDEKMFSGYLYTAGLPDPDLLIRTSGEKRISNFLLWQLSYAEFYFTDKFWPDFTSAELDKAIADFSGRVRRFGSVK